MPSAGAALPPVPVSVPVHERDGLLPWGAAEDDELPLDAYDDEDERPARSARRRVAVVGLPLMALAVVIALAWWVGTNVLSVAQLRDTGDAAPAPTAAATSSTAPTPEPPPVTPLAVTGATVFDPGGDGASENDDEVPLSFDGDPATSWTTVTYRGSPAFGGLKDGVGVVYDLGSEQALSGVTVTTQQPGLGVEVRLGGAPGGALDSFAPAASGVLTGTDTLAFAEPATTRYVLVWLTALVADEGGFTGSLAEVVPVAAG